jgi:hypothetical protein
MVVGSDVEGGRTGGAVALALVVDDYATVSVVGIGLFAACQSERGVAWQTTQAFMLVARASCREGEICAHVDGIGWPAS